jgi:hypothetical protein
MSGGVWSGGDDRDMGAGGGRGGGATVREEDSRSLIEVRIGLAWYRIDLIGMAPLSGKGRRTSDLWTETGNRRHTSGMSSGGARRTWLAVILSVLAVIVGLSFQHNEVSIDGRSLFGVISSRVQAGAEPAPVAIPDKPGYCAASRATEQTVGSLLMGHSDVQPAAAALAANRAAFLHASVDASADGRFVLARDVKTLATAVGILRHRLLGHHLKDHWRGAALLIVLDMQNLGKQFGCASAWSPTW